MVAIPGRSMFLPQPITMLCSTWSTWRLNTGGRYFESRPGGVIFHRKTGMGDFPQMKKPVAMTGFCVGADFFPKPVRPFIRELNKAPTFRRTAFALVAAIASRSHRQTLAPLDCRSPLESVGSALRRYLILTIRLNVDPVALTRRRVWGYRTSKWPGAPRPLLTVVFPTCQVQRVGAAVCPTCCALTTCRCTSVRLPVC